MQYFKQYAHDCKIYTIYSISGKDDRGFIIYEKKITNFHLVYKVKHFYNILLQQRTFRNEDFTFFENNVVKSYVHECQIKGFLHNVESLKTHLVQHANQNLFENEKQTQVFQMFFPYLDSNMKNE